MVAVKDRGPYYTIDVEGPLTLGPEECYMCCEEIHAGEEVIEATFHNEGGAGDLETRYFHKDCYIEDEEEDADGE